MATSETRVIAEAHGVMASESASKASTRKDRSILDRVLRLLSSVRFGVTMLVTVLICSMIGMLVMQVEVDGFQEYYQRLAPAQRAMYGQLGFFDIYHSWYFALLLAVTGLNIILSSIDRFPTAWQYVSKPKLQAAPNFIRAQMLNTENCMNESHRALADRVREAWRALGFRARISEQDGRLTVFAQRNTCNRLGAYVVHVGLLTIFAGGFLTMRYGAGGMMEIRPGQSSNSFNTFHMTLEGQKRGQAGLPFTVECTNLQQRLIRPEGGLDATNTIDWLSYINIKEGSNEQHALVQLNYPFDYKGYRFFQSQFTPVGDARSVTLRFEPASWGEAHEATIPRSGSADVPGVGRVEYVSFFADFVMSEEGPVNASPDYNNPAAQLRVLTPDGKSRAAFAFNPQLTEQYLCKAVEQAKGGEESPLLVSGYKVLPKGFEKVALAHTLAVQYDPGRVPFYSGSALLVLSLCGSFSSHTKGSGL
jgi:cytochrome c biogenesis protein